MKGKSSRKLLIFLIFTMGLTLTSQNIAFQFPAAESSYSLSNFIQLGYSPSTLSSLSQGTPVFSPGDSMWLLSNSSSIVSAQLLGLTGNVVASRPISAETVSRIYSFSANEPEGAWTLELTLRNSSILLMTIPFVNPFFHRTNVRLTNISLLQGELNLGFAMSSSNAYNFEACLASAEANSTIAVPIPTSLGRGEMLLNSIGHDSTISIEGVTSNSFSFWYELDYRYSYAGNVSGEFISREVPVLSSSAAVFTSIAPRNVSFTNSTALRLGRYQVIAYFESSGGLVVEQTSALLLNSYKWLWLGGCNQVQTPGSSFVAECDLSFGSSSWPTTLYIMYEVNGVDTYTSLPLNLNITRIRLTSSPGNVSTPYLSSTLNKNPDILASDEYNGNIYVIGGDFPLSLQITPMFGQDYLQTQSIFIKNSFTDNLILVPVGALSVQAKLNTVPVAGANILIQNKFGGVTSTVSGVDGLATVYIPAGQYNITVSYHRQSISENVMISTGAESTLQFSFAQNSATDYSQYLLISTFIIGIILNFWFWLIRPKQKSI